MAIIPEVPLFRRLRKLDPGNVDSILQQLGGDFNAEIADVYHVVADGPEDPRTISAINNVLKEHDKGNIHLDGMIISELLDVVEGLNKQPHYRRIPHRGLVRHDTTKEPFYIGSDRYGITQYKHALSFLDAFMGKTNTDAAYGAVTDEGARIIIVLQAGESVSLGNDKVELFYTISTTHDGTGSLVAMCTPRHKASDTILTPLGDKGSIRIKHTARVDHHMDRASHMMTKVHAYWETYSKSFVRLANLRLKDDEAMAFIYAVHPDAKESAGNRRGQNVRDKIYDIYKYGKCSNVNSCNGTLFGALVACLTFADLYKTVRESIKGRSLVDSAIESRISGDAARFKDRAYSTAIDVADNFSTALTIERKVSGLATNN